MPSALITGIGGQDGSYLADLLLSKGYVVHGVVRSSSSDLSRLAHIRGSIRLHRVDLTDRKAALAVVKKIGPSELYNLAAPTFVPLSWDLPVETGELAGMSVLYLLEAIRVGSRKTRFFQASTAEMFGRAAPAPQSETTPLNPANPYAAAKAFAHTLVGMYRSHHRLFASTGILFNHESPRRDARFVPMKIARAAARIKLNRMKKIALGRLDVKRDWGYAPDFVDAMWRTLQHRQPDDFVIATGVAHTVRHLAETAFSHVGLDYRKHVVQDPAFVRAPEKYTLIGNARKARIKLGWKPTASFEQMIDMLVDAELRQA